MAYNHGREDRKWRIWKEAEEKVLREHGVDEAVIEQICMEDRADFNSNRRFYRWTIRTKHLLFSSTFLNNKNATTLAPRLNNLLIRPRFQHLLSIPDISMSPAI